MRISATPVLYPIGSPFSIGVESENDTGGGGSVESRFIFEGTVAPTDLDRATDVREKGRVGIFGTSMAYAGSSGRVLNEAIGRDLNPLGRGSGQALVAGAVNLGTVAPALPFTEATVGSGNSANNSGCVGCGGGDGLGLSRGGDPAQVGGGGGSHGSLGPFVDPDRPTKFKRDDGCCEGLGENKDDKNTIHDSVDPGIPDWRDPKPPDFSDPDDGFAGFYEPADEIRPIEPRERWLNPAGQFVAPEGDCPMFSKKWLNHKKCVLQAAITRIKQHQKLAWETFKALISLHIRLEMCRLVAASGALTWVITTNAAGLTLGGLIGGIIGQSRLNTCIKRCNRAHPPGSQERKFCHSMCRNRVWIDGLAGVIAGFLTGMALISLGIACACHTAYAIAYTLWEFRFKSCYIWRNYQVEANKCAAKYPGCGKGYPGYMMRDCCDIYDGKPKNRCQGIQDWFYQVTQTIQFDILDL